MNLETRMIKPRLFWRFFRIRWGTGLFYFALGDTLYVLSAYANPAPVMQIRPEFRRLTLITARLHLPFACSDLPMLPMSSQSAGFLPFSAIPPHLQAIPSQVRSRLP